jgi:hypothetical protein
MLLAWLRLCEAQRNERFGGTYNVQAKQSCEGMDHAAWSSSSKSPYLRWCGSLASYVADPVGLTWSHVCIAQGLQLLPLGLHI